MIVTLGGRCAPFPFSDVPPGSLAVRESPKSYAASRFFQAMAK